MYSPCFRSLSIARSMLRIVRSVKTETSAGLYHAFLFATLSLFLPPMLHAQFAATADAGRVIEFLARIQF